MDPFRAENGDAPEDEGRRPGSLVQGVGEGGRTVNSAKNALCFNPSGETATTNTTATGTPTLQPYRIQAQDRTQIKQYYESRGATGTLTPATDPATVETKYHGVAPSAAPSAFKNINGYYLEHKFDASGYIDRWYDAWECRSYRRRRIALSGHSSATLHNLWIKKQKCKTFVNETIEDAKEMVIKRQGPWARPPPPAQNVTSNCMTCNLLMRYPKDVQEFRCSICDTVNTVATLEEKAAKREAEFLKAKKKAKNKEDAQLPQLKPLSAAFMQHVIEDCIRTYMVTRLCSEHTTGITTGTTQGSDELWEDDQLPAYTREAPPSATIYDSKHEPKYHFSAEPTLRKDMHELNISANRSSKAQLGSSEAGPSTGREPPPADRRTKYFEQDPVRIFWPARDYISHCFKSVENINHSFLTEEARRTIAERGSSARASRASRQSSEVKATSEPEIVDVDPKMLLLGDVAKNGSWWLGGRGKGQAQTASRKDNTQAALPQPEKTPSLNFTEIEEWYNVIKNAPASWQTVWNEVRSRPDCASVTAAELKRARQDIQKAAAHLNNRLMKCIENLLRRVGGQITRPEELRFLLIILENPLLDGEFKENNVEVESTKNWGSENEEDRIESVPPPSVPGSMTGRHSRILKHIIGLIANCSTELHQHFVSWFSNYDHARFVRIKDIVSGFLTYRLIRQNKSDKIPGADMMNDLIPALRPGGGASSLYAALQQGTLERRHYNTYCSDWQVKCTAQVLAILFEANKSHSSRHSLASAPAGWKPSLTQGVFLPISDFYVSMVDYVDLVADFEEFRKKGGKFSFCQYPFLMSVWAKTQVLDYDSKRQMKETARDAFFDNLLRHTQTQQTLTLDVRRDCLADDSLKAIAETMGSVSNESKKALRIKFRGEEGIDGGGLRKEWFLLLVREIFNPDLGLFEYDEDSQYCYFNPHTLYNGDQFYLVGVILGLAIYNSTILDVPLPPFAFCKLVSMSPATTQTNSLTQPRQLMNYTLGDLAQYRPRLARGLKQLLDFAGDVEQTFMRNFVAEVEKFGSRYEVPLCKGGEGIPVTNRNRREYVDLYVRYLLDSSVARQFEPFKRGFYQVCSGSAFGLFRPEEVELLVRGSDEPLDVTTLRAVAEYEEWGARRPDDSVKQVKWFWELFIDAGPLDQRKLLLFITGSDRVPAAGASMMPLRISCLGDDSDRLPVARTCFNKISLWRYASKEKMGRLLWLAVHESEGFGLQ